MKFALFGPKLSEDEILDQMAKSLVQVVLDMAKPIIRQVLLTANANGFPVEFLQYVFWTLVENQRHWPSSLTKPQKKALALMREILLVSGEIPAYRSGLEVPSIDTEDALDATLRELSNWMLKQVVPFGKEYIRQINHHCNRCRPKQTECAW